MAHRQQPRYNTAEAIRVYVGDIPYFVFLDAEIVVSEVLGRGGKVQRRQVTSRRIKTAAILKARSWSCAADAGPEGEAASDRRSV